MTERDFKGICQCPCGAVKMRLTQRPKTRFFCHCAICQAVYGKDYADISVVWAWNVAVEDISQIEFKRYRYIPVSVKRGICKSCRNPVLGYMMLLPFLNIAFIPGFMFQEQSHVPQSRGHIFYHSRKRDVEDGLPKHSGYLRSEWAATRYILSGLLRG